MSGGGTSRAVLPSEPKKSWRARKTRGAGSAPTPDAEGPPEGGAGPSQKPEAAAPADSSAPALGKEAHRMARAMDERQRLLLASGLSGGAGLARVAGTDTVAFRCPACFQQVVCSVSDAGGGMECPECRAVLRLPALDSSARVEVVSAGSLSHTQAGPAKAVLPDLRDEEEGRSSKPVFQEAVGLPASKIEGLDDWGLDQPARVANARRSRAWKWMVPLSVLLGLCVWYVLGSKLPSRTSAHEGAGTEEADPEAGKPINWATISSRKLYQLCDERIRAYLDAPTLEEKVRHVRGASDQMLRKMKTYYASRGGYEAETSSEGAPLLTLMIEERHVGGRIFQVMNVQFSKEGHSGAYVLAREDDRLAVDWEYCVGFGEVTIAELWEERPALPVQLRVYLREGLFFGDGFREEEYRQFDLEGPRPGERVIPVYAPRGSVVEQALRDAWLDASVKTLGGPRNTGQKVDVTLKIHYDNADGHSGFLIDEVVARGWIVP